MSMKIPEISAMVGDLLDDTTIPKNIRRALAEAKERLDGEDEDSVKISAAIYIIESITEDINMPSHARTQVWAIISALESLNEQGQND
ncbi:hypothetical protein GF318_06065 [Candidatus Micrarchaeota archaeon]|nr:hypothetical protein [Candidatus Micrarchaeota archaeon]